MSVERYVDNVEAILGCMRKDKKPNVYFTPLKKMFYVRSQEWSDMVLFNTSLKGVLPKVYGTGAWYTSINVSYYDKNGKFQFFTFSTLKGRNEYDFLFPRFSLRAGVYNFTVNFVVYEDLNSKTNPVDETVSETIELIVPEEGDVPVILVSSIGAKYNEYEKWDDILDKWETKRSLVGNRFYYALVQADPKKATQFYPYWSHDWCRIDVIPNGEPWGFDEPTTSWYSEPTPTYSAPKKSASKPKPAPKNDSKEKQNAITYFESDVDLVIGDDYGEKGLFGGARLNAIKDGYTEIIRLEETRNPSTERSMIAEIKDGGNSTIFFENSSDRIGGILDTNNRGGIFYKYKDSYGYYQRFAISINPTYISVYQVVDGYLTGNGYRIDDDVNELACDKFKTLSSKRLISSPVSGSYFTLDYWNIPKAITGKTIKTDFNDSINVHRVAQYLGSSLNGYGLYNCYNNVYVGSQDSEGFNGVGIYKESGGKVYGGGFKNGKRHGLIFTTENDVDYIYNYKDGKIDGTFIEIYDDRVIIGKVDYYGNIADKSVVIYHGSRGFGFYNSIDRDTALSRVPKVYHNGGGMERKL